MREVISDLLWIGHAWDARHVSEVLIAGIKAVVDKCGRLDVLAESRRQACFSADAHECNGAIAGWVQIVVGYWRCDSPGLAFRYPVKDLERQG